MLKVVYAFFLGVLLTTFLGVGIATFYPAPKMPEPSTEVKFPDASPTAEDKQRLVEFDAQQQAYQKESSVYNRNVSLIALGFSIVLLIISLLFATSLEIVSDGVLLGGVFTLFYSIIRSFVSEDVRYRFVVITVSLIVALYMGYRKFVQENKRPSGSRKA